MAILLTFLQLNNWPLERMGYDTNTAYGSFVFERNCDGAAVRSCLGADDCPRSSRELSRCIARRSRDGCGLAQAFTLRGLRSKEFFSSAMVGLVACGGAHRIHRGVLHGRQTFRRLGAAGIELRKFGEHHVSVDFGRGDRLAGVDERRIYVPVVCDSLFEATDGLEHCRCDCSGVLLELSASAIIRKSRRTFAESRSGLIGIVAGMVMLRWGILATLIWHYTVDASLVGLLLVRSNSLYFKISGVVVGRRRVAPLIFAGVSYLARGRFEPDEDLLNSAEPIPED